MILKRLGGLWGRRGPSGGHLRPFWVHLGPSRKHLGVILAVLEAILGVLEASWTVLGPSWGHRVGLLCRHRGHLGDLLGDLGGLLRRPEPSECREEANAKIFQKPSGNQ